MMVELVVAECDLGDERIVAQELLRKFIGNVKISRTEYGKPFCTDYPDLHFNISHTRGYAAVARAPYPIGVDIELLSRFERLSDNEHFIRRVYAVSEIEITDPISLLTAWTRKEAYLKLIGTGFRSLPSKINTKSLAGIQFKQAYFDGTAMCTISAANNNL